MNIILVSFLVLGSLGLLFGIVLLICSKKFHVVVDPRIEKITDTLPGANCGACGLAGCKAFAKSAVQEKVSPTACSVAAEESINKIAKILGVKTETRISLKVRLVCRGGTDIVKKKYKYTGIKECREAAKLQNGDKECIYGCLGYGTCVNVCPFDAMVMGKNGLPIINEDKCTGCGKCVEVCPRNVLSLIPLDKNIFVACQNKDKGPAAKKVCAVACIGCGLCMRKACEFNAITVENFLATINPEKCTLCGKCVDICPTKAIICL